MQGVNAACEMRKNTFKKYHLIIAALWKIKSNNPAFASYRRCVTVIAPREGTALKVGDQQCTDDHDMTHLNLTVTPVQRVQ